MSDVLLTVSGVSKHYKKPSWSGGKATANVLSDIDLTLVRGESVGVLGRNGAGKSTLLKVLDGALTCDVGEVETKGAVASIIELSSNIVPSMTGLENAATFFRMHGYNGGALKEKVALALDFADLDDSLYRDVSKYSSGMRARLAFSMAIHLDFDILLIDEVLAVGDFEFQQKCLSTLNALRKNVAIVFVSHSINTQRQFCDRGIVLDKGRLVFEGGIDESINHYLNRSQKSAPSSIDNDKLVMYGDEFFNVGKVSSVEVSVNKSSFLTHERMEIRIDARFLFNPADLIVGLPIWDDDGRLVTALNSDYGHDRIRVVNRYFKSTIVLDCDLNPGEYHCVIAIVDGAEYLYRKPAFKFVVRQQPRLFGFFTPSANWKYEV